MYHVRSIGQGDVLMDDISQQLEDMVEAHLKNRLWEYEISTDTLNLGEIFQFEVQDSTQRLEALAVHRSQIDLLTKDKGLGFRAGFAKNIGASIIQEDGSFFDWRAQAGLDWNLFRDGLVSRQHQIRERELRWAAKQSEFDQLASDKNYRENFDFIIYTFNRRKIALIKERLNLLDQLADINNKLFYLKFTQWESVLALLSKKTETELFLKNYETYLQSVEIDSARRSLNVQSLPIFNLDFDKIQAKGADTTVQHRSLVNNLAAIDHQHHWTKDLSLNTQLRYNYYDGAVTSQFDARDFLSVGFTLGIPIPFKGSSNKKLISNKKKKLEGEYQEYLSIAENDLLTHFYEYQYTLKQFVHSFYKKARMAVLIERNLSQRNLQDPNYSPMQVVDRLDDLFSVDLDLLDIQQRLYLKALKIFHMIGAQNIVPFIQMLDYSYGTKKFASGTSIFLDHPDFSDLAGNFIAEYVQYNDIRELVINADNQPELYIKYAELLDHVHENGLPLEIRFSLRPEDFSFAALEELREEAGFALTPFLHLDFRAYSSDTLPGHPHLITHINTVVAALAVSNNVSVSLPLEGSESLRKALYANVSRIHVLPNKSEDLAGLFALVTGQTGEDPQKIQLTLKPKDFNSRLEMDNFSRELKDHLKLTNVGISSLGDMLHLERQTVGWHEERGF